MGVEAAQIYATIGADVTASESAMARAPGIVQSFARRAKLAAGLLEIGG